MLLSGSVFDFGCRHCRANRGDGVDGGRSRSGGILTPHKHGVQAGHLGSEERMDAV